MFLWNPIPSVLRLPWLGRIKRVVATRVKVIDAADCECRGINASGLGDAVSQDAAIGVHLASRRDFRNRSSNGNAPD